MPPLPVPFGMTFDYRGTRICFVEAVDNIVLRFIVEGTDEEFLIETDNGLRVRPTVRWVLDEFAAENLKDCSTCQETLTEWQGRFMGLDRAAVLATRPGDVLKYDIALAALLQGKPRSQDSLREFAASFYDDPANAPSGRSVIRWMDTLEANGRKVGAMKNRSGRQTGTSQLPPIVDRLVHQATAVFWGDEFITKMKANALLTHAWFRLKDAGVKGIGQNPPSKTAVVNRINKAQNKETYGARLGKDEADRQFLAAGNSVKITRPFELVYADGTEFRQICLYSDSASVPSGKMKSIGLIDAFSLFAFRSTPFSGPYRAEMGMGAIDGALTAPHLDEATLAQDPLLVLAFGRIGRLRVDNDKAILPPTAIGNLTGVISQLELCKAFGPDEKANIENYFGWLKAQLNGLPGTVLSPRSRRRSIRRDPVAEAVYTRAEFCRRHELLRLLWNSTAHVALGNRTPNEVMLEYIATSGIAYQPTAEVRRCLARTVSGVITTDGVVFDHIRYIWNRAGVTQHLSDNVSLQKLRGRLEGTTRLAVHMRVYDWNLDFIEVFDEANQDFVKLWSDDQDYTAFLTRFEHRFHMSCVSSGASGAQTNTERARRQAQNLHDAWRDLHTEKRRIAFQAAAVLEAAERRKVARDEQVDPDLKNFDHLLMLTDVAGQNGPVAPQGPSITRALAKGATAAGEHVPPVHDWGGLEPNAQSSDPSDEDHAEDFDGGIDWDEDDAEGADFGQVGGLPEDDN